MSSCSQNYDTLLAGPAKRPFFDNPGLYAFFLYYFASLINDPVVRTLDSGGLFSPRQLAIVVGIGYLALFRGPASSPLYRRSIRWIIAFYFVCALSYFICLLEGNAFEPFLTTLVTSGMNILWLVVVGRVLSMGLTERDKRSVLGALLILGVVPLLTGLYEVASGGNILQGVGTARHGVSKFFYVQGLHVDKINFITVLAPPIFACAAILPQAKGVFKKGLLAAYLSAAIVCLFQSFSTTGILGVMGGLLLLVFLYGSIRRRLAMLFVLSLCVYVIFFNLDSDRGQDLVARYEMKYEKRSQVDGSPRLIRASVCVREFTQNPIIGVGFGNHVPITNAETNGWGGGGNAHCAISVFTDLGLFGGIPFAVFWFTLYVSAFRFLRRCIRGTNKEDEMLAGVIAGLSVFVFARLLLYYHAMSDEAFFIWPALVYASIGNRNAAVAARKIGDAAIGRRAA